MRPDQQNELKQLQDGATEALKRAARRARSLAIQTGTKIVVMRNGNLVREMPAPETNAEDGDP